MPNDEDVAAAKALAARVDALTAPLIGSSDGEGVAIAIDYRTKAAETVAVIAGLASHASQGTAGAREYYEEASPGLLERLAGAVRTLEANVPALLAAAEVEPPKSS